MAGAYKTGKYRNVFKEYGYPEEEIQKRVEDTFNTIFYGNDDERFYHEAGDDMGYMEDTGNHDVRTEGMSYGMMVCVQLDKKAEFDSRPPHCRGSALHAAERNAVLYEKYCCRERQPYQPIAFQDGCGTRRHDECGSGKQRHRRYHSRTAQGRMRKRSKKAQRKFYFP